MGGLVVTCSCPSPVLFFLPASTAACPPQRLPTHAPFAIPRNRFPQCLGPGAAGCRWQAVRARRGWWWWRSRPSWLAAAVSPPLPFLLQPPHLCPSPACVPGRVGAEFDAPGITSIGAFEDIYSQFELKVRELVVWWVRGWFVCVWLLLCEGRLQQQKQHQPTACPAPSTFSLPCPPPVYRRAACRACSLFTCSLPGLKTACRCAGGIYYGGGMPRLLHTAQTTNGLSRVPHHLSNCLHLPPLQVANPDTLKYCNVYVPVLFSHRSCCPNVLAR